MSEHTHTPGPWDAGCFIDPDSSCQCSYILCETLPGSIATVHYGKCVNAPIDHGGGYPSIDEARANARLIAAAPTMRDYIAKRANEGCAEALKILEAIDANS